ncbi:MAG: hypothetical protein IJL61_01275 [Bacteroidales bacterium]|nr:hypothetical protein [Bacteroidales bacterium]
MDSPFIYDRYVTGKNFIGNKEDATILGNLIAHGENITIYAPPKSGKHSLIQQVLFNLRISGTRFAVGQADLVPIRTVSDFLLTYGATAIRTVASTPDEYSRIISNHLGGTHFVFDRLAFSDHDQIISLNWDPDDNDLERMLLLPYLIGSESGQHIVMILDEFQNLDKTEDGERVWKAMENVIRENKPTDSPACSFVLTGSQVNAMKSIFKDRRFFYRLVEHFPIREPESKVIAEHIVKGFLSGGKVVDRELILGVCSLLRNNMWYINHFSSICDYLTRGYITEPMLIESLGILLSIHEPRFKATMDDLTTFQVSLLRAIVDGKKKFSSADIIKGYGLNSSANVRRLKDALMKKEIVTFDDEDNPSIIDPLFEYWVKKYYFKIEV